MAPRTAHGHVADPWGRSSEVTGRQEPGPQLQLSLRLQSCCRGSLRRPPGRMACFRAGEDGVWEGPGLAAGSISFWNEDSWL